MKGNICIFVCGADCPFKTIFRDRTFDVKLRKLQLLLMVTQKEVEVLPRYFLLVVKACSLHHGPDAIFCLAL